MQRWLTVALPVLWLCAAVDGTEPTCETCFPMSIGDTLVYASRWKATGSSGTDSGASVVTKVVESSYTRGDTTYYLWACRAEADTGGVTDYSDTVRVIGNGVYRGASGTSLLGLLEFPECRLDACPFPPGPLYACDSACLFLSDSSQCCAYLFTCDSQCLATGYCAWSCWDGDTACLRQCVGTSDTAGCCWANTVHTYSLVSGVVLPWPYGGSPTRVVDSCYRVEDRRGWPTYYYEQTYLKGVGLVREWSSRQFHLWGSGSSSTLTYASNKCSATAVSRLNGLSRPQARVGSARAAYDLAGRRLTGPVQVHRNGVLVVTRLNGRQPRLVFTVGR